MTSTTEADHDGRLTERLPDLLRGLHGALREHLAPYEQSVEQAPEGLRRVVERLERDLLPRTAGGVSHLVVGIVGPNNAGKSALFNALVGACISPSLATGGATKRLVGAAHPDLVERFENEESLARFTLRRATPGPDGVALALESPEAAAELVLVPTLELEDGILLVDAPDFDSINERNRATAEALLRVTDLALVVVTRHTYQNRDVVAFLEEWLAHGRPWLCVYNEALSPELTSAHVAKLADDVGAPPVATFAAPFDLAVAEGRAPLNPRRLAGEDVALAAWLFDHTQKVDLKTEALAASLGQLRDELTAAHTSAVRARDGAAAIQDVAREQALRLGKRVASAAMPMGPFLEAFRAVLDRRPNLLQRGLRGTLRKGRALVVGTVNRVRGARASTPPADPDAKLVDHEREALAPAWPPFFELLATELPERAAGAGDVALAALVAADLAPAQLGPAGERAALALAADPQVLVAFREACEQLIEEELAARGNEWMLQLAVDAVHLVPAVAAGIVIVNTGGLGADVAVGSAGAVTSMLAERVSRLLGSAVAWRARDRWSQLRGARIAELALAAALPRSGARMNERRTRGGDLTAVLDRALEELR